MSAFYLYIDPGTGSLATQMVIAGAIAGWVFFKNFFRRIFYRNKAGGNPNADEIPDSKL